MGRGSESLTAHQKARKMSVPAIVFGIGFAVMLLTIPAGMIAELYRCGRKALCWALALAAFTGGAVWLWRGVVASAWRTDQAMHIRWNVTCFGQQYDRICGLGDESLRHAYVTNFCANACTLLNYDLKFAPNTSNSVERYYHDWDERIDKLESARSKAAR